MTARPIDFVYDLESDTYDLSQFKTDEELLRKV